MAQGSVVTKIVHVAVGVIQNADGKILIARRADTAHQGGLWEFPGGKVDAGESLPDALTRELREELAIEIERTEPLIQIRHDYSDKSVLLDVHKVTAFSGVAQGNEGQPILWVSPSELSEYAFPAANKAIITALSLPEKMLITGTFISRENFFSRLEYALKHGIKLVQLRCPEEAFSDHPQLALQAQALCLQYQARLVWNTSLEKLNGLPDVGLHLNRRELKRYQLRPVDDSVLLGASCHNAEEIALARQLGADYICLSPVAETTSHPNEAVLGWEKFAELARRAAIPVYALGGMNISDIGLAHQHGGQGIAAISCFWLPAC